MDNTQIDKNYTDTDDDDIPPPYIYFHRYSFLYD